VTHVHFFHLIKMNGYKCGLCQRWLASKYSLERHIRLKHKSDLEENTSSAKKPKLEIEEQMQENNSTHIDIDKLDIKKASDIDSDQESDNNTELNRNNNKVVYANNAGWVDTDNKEELDNNNSKGEESNMEYSQAEESNMQSDNTEDEDNMRLDNNKESDNNSESEESVVDAEEPNNSVSVKDLDYKHDLFDIAETSKEMCDRFKYCLRFATFRIHPPPVPIRCFNMYGKWLENVFGGILEYIAPKYSPDPEDFVSLNIFHADTKKSIWIGPIKHKELNVGYVETEFLKEKLTNPSGDLTVGLNCVKSKVTCPTCGHTKVSKDGVSYTD